jgi:hypothetical protein
VDLRPRCSTSTLSEWLASKSTFRLLVPSARDTSSWADQLSHSVPGESGTLPALSPYEPAQATSLPRCTATNQGRRRLRRGAARRRCVVSRQAVGSTHICFRSWPGALISARYTRLALATALSLRRSFLNPMGTYVPSGSV